VNVERLHSIALALQDDLRIANITSHMQQLVSALQNQIYQPGQPEYQQQVGQSRLALQNALNISKVNKFSPTWLQVLEEIGASPLIGLKLGERVGEIFLRNQITPSVALEELQAIFTEFQALSTSIDQMVVAFEQLKIGSEALTAGGCEVGILVPRMFVNNRLDKFTKELSELNLIFGDFAEVATGERPGFEIRTISSSDLSIFFDTASMVGACIAIAMERIIALYKQLLEIRKLHGELVKQGLAKESLEGIEKHVNSHMEQGIEIIVSELLTEFHNGADQRRKSELSISLKYTLKKLANRVDRGFNIEVRMNEPEPTESEANEQEGQTGKDTKKHYARIADAAETLQFLKLEGDPILRLTEDKNEDEKKAL
jgi:hypothetical protein